MEKLSECKIGNFREKKKITWRNFRENAGEKRVLKAKYISFMKNHKISWSNAGEIPPAFLQKILHLIMEKNDKRLF